jgi:diguanylate cyclase (GGDEF)-like protein
MSFRFIFFISVFLFIFSCEKDTKYQPNKLSAYTSFREVPGITAAEIEAVEAIKAKNISFIYGMPESTESFYGQNGEIKGYVALLCKHLTEIFGINFKPALYEWDDLIAGLASGDVDFTSDLTANDERRKIYHMTDAIVERSLKYFRLKDATPISQIANSRLPRYGFLEEAITLSKVSLFSDEEFEVFFVPSHNVVYDALKSGQIDAFLDEDGMEAMFDHYDDIVSSYYLPLIYISASLATQKAELAPIISIVQKMLKNDYMSYLIGMYNQGHREYVKSKLERSFNEEEREYMRQNPVVHFAAEFDNYPKSFYNKHENQWHGIVFDVLKEVEKVTGLSFEVVNASDTQWPALLQMLEAGTASMISELIYTKERENSFLWSEAAFMQNKYALISKLEYPDINANEILQAKIGLNEGTVYADMFKLWFPNHSNVVEFKNTIDALLALENGDIDLFMTSHNTLLTMTNYMELPGYKINFLFDRSFESYLGFNKNEHILRSIVEKVLQQIDVKGISERWEYKSYDYRTKLAESQLPWLIGASILFFFIIILMIILYKIIRNEGKRLEFLVQKRTAEINEQRKLLEYLSLTDQLTGLPNRRNFDMRLDIEWRIAIREKQAISFMMLDIDDFKSYNDKFGHQQGDEVLRIIAKTIEQTLKRPSDFVARWGGEEFAILLSNTGVEGALKIAELIRVNVEKTNITVSIGVNTQSPEQSSSLESFISVADKELYKAKGMGKNRVCIR